MGCTQYLKESKKIRHTQYGTREAAVHAAGRVLPVKREDGGSNMHLGAGSDNL